MNRPESEDQVHSGELADFGGTGDEPKEQQQPPRARKQTILLAVGIGFIATICMLVFVISERMNSFDGVDRITELLDSANNLTGDEFEPVETTAGSLEDWFFLKHGLEHYAVPKQFADAKTIGCRVFKFNGANVAQIMALGDKEKEILLYLFPADDLGIKMPNGKWEIIQGDQWVGGLKGVGDTCFLIAFRGNKEQMNQFIASRTK